MKKLQRMVAFMVMLTVLGSGIVTIQDQTLLYAENVSAAERAAIINNASITNSVSVTNTTAATSGSSYVGTTAANGLTTTTSANEINTTTASSYISTTQSKQTISNTPAATTERKAVWMSFDDLDFSSKTKKSKAKYTKQIQTMFDNVKKWGMNTVVVHVRPFSDAMYESDYFPWSDIASNKQGKHPGYDPLEIMTREAHNRGLSIEAWINPYRVTLSSTNIKQLSSDNPARKWYSKNATKRNVLVYGGKIYYNPSKPAVRKLITNGVKEIVENYDVDAIHFDDYFYPTFTKWNYKSVFDAKEYNAYVKNCKDNGKSYQSIVGWRRNQVNLLIKEVYQTVKKANPNVEFGISPAGNIENLLRKDAYYVDISKWVTQSGYVDYICPQIYWGFQNGAYSYPKVLDKWEKLCKKKKVKLYIGLAMYRTVYYGSSEWKSSNTIMKRSVALARKHKISEGYYFFTYKSFLSSRAAKEKKNLIAELNKKK